MPAVISSKLFLALQGLQPHDEKMLLWIDTEAMKYITAEYPEHDFHWEKMSDA